MVLKCTFSKWDLKRGFYIRSAILAGHNLCISEGQSVGVINSYGVAMSFLANLLQTAVQAFFDFSGLGFIQELTVVLSRLGSNPIGRSGALTPRRERKFLLNIMTFFRRTVWFLAFSSIYLVSPSLGLITVGRNIETTNSLVEATNLFLGIVLNFRF